MGNVLTNAKMHKGEKQREKKRQFYSSSVHCLLQSVTVRPSKLFTMSFSAFELSPLPHAPPTRPKKLFSPTPITPFSVEPPPPSSFIVSS